MRGTDNALCNEMLTGLSEFFQRDRNWKRIMVFTAAYMATTGTTEFETFMETMRDKWGDAVADFLVGMSGDGDLPHSNFLSQSFHSRAGTKNIAKLTMLKNDSGWWQFETDDFYRTTSYTSYTSTAGTSTFLPGPAWTTGTSTTTARF